MFKKFFAAFALSLHRSMMAAMLMATFIGLVGLTIPEAFGGAGWAAVALPPAWRLPVLAALAGWFGWRASRVILARQRRRAEQADALTRMFEQSLCRSVPLPPLTGTRRWEIAKPTRSRKEVN